MELGFAVLRSLASHLPVYIAWGVGVVFAVSRWNRHPQVSLYVVLALAGMLLVNLIGTTFSIVMPMRMRENGMTAAQMGVFFTVEATVTSLISAGLWGLLIAAIFGWRNPSPAPARTVSSGA